MGGEVKEVGRAVDFKGRGGREGVPSCRLGTGTELDLDFPVNFCGISGNVDRGGNSSEDGERILTISEGIII